MSARRHALLDQVAEAAELVALQSRSISADIAKQIGAMVADKLTELWGGQTLYFPADHGFQLTDRDRAMLEAHRSGKLIHEIAAEFKISEQWVRQLLRRAEIRDKNLRQRRLFDDPR